MGLTLTTPAKVPVDAPELVALCATKPVFIGAEATNGDGWVDAKRDVPGWSVGGGRCTGCWGRKTWGRGSFRPSRRRWLTATSHSVSTAGGHTPGPNWPTFLRFAVRYFDKTAKKRAN